MKKENNNTNINTNIKNQEEKVMRKEIKLEKFTDEDMIRYEWELNALYQGREHFIRDFQELYINGNCQIEEINNAIPMMIDYINDFATSARVWNNILETSKYKSFYAKKSEYDNKEMNENIKTRILNSYRPTENDAEQVVYRIYATIAVAVYNATFAPDGQYRVVKMAYRDYKKKFIVPPERYEYTCVNTLKCMAVYVKTGEYDPETKTIEVYIPANWDGDDARWWCARKAGDLPEIAAEMAQMAAEAVENDNNEENSTTEEEKEMKKEMMIETVENTYDIVGAARTINNYTGISDNEFESDYVEYIVRNLFDEDEIKEREKQDRLIEYYEQQPEKFFEELDSEDLVIRMAEDLIEIEYAEISARYGFKELNYSPYDPEYATNEADYNWEMGLDRACMINEIKQAIPELKRRMNAVTFKKLIDWCKTFGYGDWRRFGVDDLTAMIFDLKRGYSPEECLKYTIESEVIFGR